LKLIKWIIFIIATIFAFLTIFWLPRLERKIPPVPEDEIHLSITTIKKCIECHIIDKKGPFPQNHPARRQCVVCHALKSN